MNDRLDEIEARANAATSGPWGVESSYGDGYPLFQICAVLRDRYGDNAITSNDRSTVEFIAAAREDVPWLVAEIRQLRSALISQASAAIVQVDQLKAQRQQVLDLCDEIYDVGWDIPGSPYQKGAARAATRVRAALGVTEDS